MTDLVGRLWASDVASALTNEAAREIERLREERDSQQRVAIAAMAENERLRRVLRPFGASKRVFDAAEPGMPDSHAYKLTWNMGEGRCDFTLGQFRRARAALEVK